MEELSLEFVRVVEEAAIAAARTMGRGDRHFADQLLMGGFDPAVISAGLAAALVVFFLGLVFWGDRFKLYRRTTIIFFGIAGGAGVVAGALLVNHSEGMAWYVQALGGAMVIAGLFVLSGATPAALGLLADVSERYPLDRGAIMGLYSVFLALGQIGGSLLGGQVARFKGIDAILLLTLAFLAIALLPLWRLRSFEHQLSPDPALSPAELEPT